MGKGKAENNSTRPFPFRCFLSLPKWQLTSALDLKAMLEAMSMKKAFGSEADGGGEALHANTMAHKAFVEANEERTETAAATGAAMLPLAMPVEPAPVPVFGADHPFAVAIQHAHT